MSDPVSRPGDAEAPYCHLLYIGRETEAALTLIDAARASGWFERIATVEPSSGDPADIVVDRALWAADYRGCLVVVWDFDGLAEACGEPPEAPTISEGSRFSRTLQAARRWSQQVISLGLTATPRRLSFRDLVDLVAREVAAVGDLAFCQATLRSWCAPDADGAGLSLRASFDKRPSGWLGFIRHDFLGIARDGALRPALVERGLETHLARVDYLQDALRNVLLHVDCNARARLLDDQTLPADLKAESAAGSVRLIVPPCLAHGLVRLGARDGTDFVVYPGHDELAPLIADVVGDDSSAAVLLWDGHDEPPAFVGATPEATVPVVWFGDEAPRATWANWQRLLARNVLGGYDRRSLLPDGAANRRPILEIKPSCWRTFGHRTMADATRQILDTMRAVDTALCGQLSEHKAKKLARCFDEVKAAYQLYFGPVQV